MKNLKIGFIGLGIMGLPMSQNLYKAGYDVVAYDRSEYRIKQAKEAGLSVVSTADEVAKECTIIITMLPDSPYVKELLVGETGIAKSMVPGTLIIDMTSGAPNDSKEIFAELKKKEIHFIDAPVSGGEPMAISGDLAIMVGGEEADFNRAKPLFDIMGSCVTRVGPIGSGNICKLTNQIIVAVNIAALAEGLMLAKKPGADMNLVFRAIQNGLAGSNVMNAKAPMMLADNYNPGFRIDLHIKDLINAVNAGEIVDAPLPLTKEMLDVFKQLSEEGDGGSDHSAVAKHYENLAHTRFSE